MSQRKTKQQAVKVTLPSEVWAPQALFVVEDAHQHVVGIFDSPVQARAYAHAAYRRNGGGQLFSVRSVAHSGADGGYVPGSERPLYQPSLMGPVSKQYGSRTVAD